MRYLRQLLVVGGLVGSSLLLACNETTRDDVTAARNRVEEERRRLDEVKREEGRAIDEEKREAEQAHLTNKPVVGDDPNEGAREESREVGRAQGTAEDRIREQEKRLEEAKRKEAETKGRLELEQSRDTFLIDCKAAIDQANRAVEKLQIKKNAASESEQESLDEQIINLKTKRDALQGKINDIRGAELMRWSDHRGAAQKTMDELNRESGNVS